MRILLITDGKVSGEISGAMLAEVLANNPGIEAIEDTFGLGRVIGMSYTNGALSGEPAPEPVASPQPEQIIAEVTAATQKRLDDFARTRNYDGILSACTYATSSVPKFTAEGQYAVDARDNTWATLYAFMDDVQAGAQPMPTGFADVEPFLPYLNWP